MLRRALEGVETEPVDLSEVVEIEHKGAACMHNRVELALQDRRGGDIEPVGEEQAIDAVAPRASDGQARLWCVGRGRSGDVPSGNAPKGS